MDYIAQAFRSQWWIAVVRGVLAVVFGVVAWAWPGLTLYALVVLFGAYALVSGIMSLAGIATRRRQGLSPWPFAFQGIIGIAAGLVVFAWPDISSLALIYVVAAWAFLTGVAELAAAVTLRQYIDDEWFLVLTGIASIAYGVIAAFFPGDGALALVWTIGVYAIISGVLLIAFGIRLHGWNGSPKAAATVPPLRREPA